MCSGAFAPEWTEARDIKARLRSAHRVLCKQYVAQSQRSDHPGGRWDGDSYIALTCFNLPEHVKDPMRARRRGASLLLGLSTAGKEASAHGSGEIGAAMATLWLDDAHQAAGYSIIAVAFGTVGRAQDSEPLDTAYDEKAFVALAPADQSSPFVVMRGTQAAIESRRGH